MLPHVFRRPLTPLSRLLVVVAAALPLIGMGVIAPPPASALLPTTTTVTVQPGTVLVGQPATLTATVSIVGLGGVLVTPSRQVSFSASSGGQSVALGSANLPSGCLLTLQPCSASLTTTELPLGEVTVTASYAGDGLASPSSGTTQVTVKTTVPAAPTLTAESMTGIVRLEWGSADDGGSPPTGYQLYRSTAADGAYTAITGVLPTGHYDDTTGVVGTTYFYKAKVLNAQGASPYSNVASGAPTALAPQPGRQTSDVTQCTPGPSCENDPVSRSADGSATELSASTGASGENHTLTSAIGGPAVQGCTTDYIGWSGTFNDTSTDAYKEILVEITGNDALQNMEDGWVSDDHLGCLGLGTPWKTGPGPDDNAVWSPADGLYVGTPARCNDMGPYRVNGDVDDYDFVPGWHDYNYSQPCVNTFAIGGHHYYSDRHASSDARRSAETYNWQPTVWLEYELPPGDGVISGSRCC